MWLFQIKKENKKLRRLAREKSLNPYVSLVLEIIKKKKKNKSELYLYLFY